MTAWGLVTIRLYLINGRQMLGVISQGMQNRQDLKD